MFNKCLLKSSWYFMKKNSPAAQKTCVLGLPEDWKSPWERNQTVVAFLMRLKSDSSQSLCSPDRPIWHPAVGAHVHPVPHYSSSGFLPSGQWRLRCITPGSLPPLGLVCLLLLCHSEQLQRLCGLARITQPWPGSGNTKGDTHVHYHSPTAHFGCQITCGVASS